MNTIDELHRLAEKAINARDYVGAHAYCVSIIKANPQHADAYFLLGIIHIEIAQIAKATKLIDKAIILAPAHDEYYAYLAKCHSLLGDISATLNAAEKVQIDKVKNALTLDTLGVSLSRIGWHEKALDCFKAALVMVRDNASFYYNYAVSCKFSGDFKQAKIGFERAIALRPNYHEAYYAMSDLGGINQDNNHIKQLEQLLSTMDSPDASLHLAHALAKEYESLGKYPEAFAVLNTAKARKRKNTPYDFIQDESIFKLAGPASWDDISQTTGFDSKQPIFVMGMPRSGTTLVERIISHHSDVVSCGELQDFGLAVKELTQTNSNKVLDVETLQAAKLVDCKKLGQRYIERTAVKSGKSKHFVDKLPFNFFYIALILRALPNAKIICLVRNPMDTCIGNYRQLFSFNSPYSSYSYDLKDTGRYYQQFYHLVNKWQQGAPANLKILNYEKLVSEPEPQIKQLIAFCGLEWQEQCLHAHNNKAPVSTASKVQVREPINTSSIGRWRKYGDATLALQQFFDEQNIPY